jgi:hypothetical protein
MSESSGNRLPRHFWDNVIDESLLTLSTEEFGRSGNGQVSYLSAAGTLNFRQIERELIPSGILPGRSRPKVQVECVDETGTVEPIISGLLLGTSLSGDGMFIHDCIPEDGQLIGPLVIEYEDHNGDLAFTTFTSLLAEPIPAAA